MVFRRARAEVMLRRRTLAQFAAELFGAGAVSGVNTMAEEKGYYGTPTDPNPNEYYTLAGQVKAQADEAQAEEEQADEAQAEVTKPNGKKK